MCIQGGRAKKNHVIQRLDFFARQQKRYPQDNFHLKKTDILHTFLSSLGPGVEITTSILRGTVSISFNIFHILPKSKVIIIKLFSQTCIFPCKSPQVSNSGGQVSCHTLKSHLCGLFPFEHFYLILNKKLAGRDLAVHSVLPTGRGKAPVPACLIQTQIECEVTAEM